MQRWRLGAKGPVVSRVCLGAMNFGTPGWGCDRDAAAAIVATYRDAGGTFFDTADVYGGGASEEILGELLRGARHDVVIATKVGMSIDPVHDPAGMAPARLRPALERSLRRLGTDYVDLYQLHHYDHTVPLAETLGAMDELVRAGLVRYVGCSNYFAWQIAEAMGVAAEHGLAPLVSAQMMYNLIRRDVEREHVDCAARYGLGLIAYGPLHSGMLAGGWTSRDLIPPTSRIGEFPEVYLGDEARAFGITAALVDDAAALGATPGQLALAWVLGNRSIASVLTAAQSPGELSEQLLAVELEIPAEVAARLDAASALPVTYPADFYERLGSRK